MTAEHTAELLVKMEGMGGDNGLLTANRVYTSRQELEIPLYGLTVEQAATILGQMKDGLDEAVEGARLSIRAAREANGISEEDMKMAIMSMLMEDEDEDEDEDDEDEDDEVAKMVKGIVDALEAQFGETASNQ